jgi:hypothetical protein
MSRCKNGGKEGKKDHRVYFCLSFCLSVFFLEFVLSFNFLMIIATTVRCRMEKKCSLKSIPFCCNLQVFNTLQQPHPSSHQGSSKEIDSLLKKGNGKTGSKPKNTPYPPLCIVSF